MVGTHALYRYMVKEVSCGGVFDLAVEQPQLFRKLPKRKAKQTFYPMGLIQYYQITCQPVNQSVFLLLSQLYFVILFQQNVLLLYSLSLIFCKPFADIIMLIMG